MRRRIGVMIPSTNTTVEADFSLISRGGFTVHGQRLWLTADVRHWVEDLAARQEGRTEPPPAYFLAGQVVPDTVVDKAAMLHGEAVDEAYAVERPAVRELSVERAEAVHHRPVARG
jgi:hypothetical protein